MTLCPGTWFTVFLERRRAGDGACALVESPEQGLVAEHIPGTILNLVEADHFLVQRRTEKWLAVVETKGARAADASHFDVGGVMCFGKGRGEGCQREAGVSSCTASCGRTSLYVCTNALTTRCCRLAFAVADLAAWALSTRCMRSCAPVACGLAGGIR